MLVFQKELSSLRSNFNDNSSKSWPNSQGKTPDILLLFRYLRAATTHSASILGWLQLGVDVLWLAARLELISHATTASRSVCCPQWPMCSHSYTVIWSTRRLKTDNFYAHRCTLNLQLSTVHTAAPAVNCTIHTQIANSTKTLHCSCSQRFSEMKHEKVLSMSSQAWSLPLIKDKSPSPFISFKNAIIQAINDTWTGQLGIYHALTVAHSKTDSNKVHIHI